MSSGEHHGLLDALMGIGWTGHHGGHLAEEHRQIVLMIADGENIAGRHFEQPA